MSFPIFLHTCSSGYNAFLCTIEAPMIHLVINPSQVNLISGVICWSRAGLVALPTVSCLRRILILSTLMKPHPQPESAVQYNNGLMITGSSYHVITCFYINHWLIEILNTSINIELAGWAGKRSNEIVGGCNSFMIQS